MKSKNQSRQWFQIKAEGHTAEILIYDRIGEGFFEEGVSAKGLLQELDSMEGVTEINVRINSPGGDVFDGVAIHNALERNPAKVNVHIDGLAASIASVIAMAGDHIIMADNALMMIHNPNTIAMGDASAMRKTADLLDKAKEALVRSYLAQAGMDLRAEIETMMDETTWFTAEEALEFGLVDEVGNAVKIAAHFDLSQMHFANVPDALKNQEPTKKILQAVVDRSVPRQRRDADGRGDDSGAQPADGMPINLAKNKLKIYEMVSKETV